jgi:hypothetical protein
MELLPEIKRQPACPNVVDAAEALAGTDEAPDNPAGNIEIVERRGSPIRRSHLIDIHGHRRCTQVVAMRAGDPAEQISAMGVACPHKIADLSFYGEPPNDPRSPETPTLLCLRLDGGQHDLEWRAISELVDTPANPDQSALKTVCNLLGMVNRRVWTSRTKLRPPDDRRHINGHRAIVPRRS